MNDENKVYEYPALFTKTEGGKKLEITFPDFPDAFSECENPEYAAALELGMNIVLKRETGQEIPSPSGFDEIPLDESMQSLERIRISEKTIRERIKTVDLL